MKSVIVGVATPVYPSTPTAADKRKVNAAAKEALLGRFPGATVVYDGKADGLKAAPRIKFYAKLPVDDPAVAEVLAAAGGKRPTIGKSFAGAFMVDVNAQGVIPARLPDLDPAALAGMTLRALTELGASRGVKIPSGVAKATAIARLLGA